MSPSNAPRLKNRQPAHPVLRALPLALVCGAVACTQDSVSGLLVASAVEITPNGGEVAAGQPLQLTAIPRSSSGIEIPDRTVLWSSENPTIATVSSTGVVTGVRTGGPVLITAMVDGVSDAVPVMVVPTPVVAVTVQPQVASMQEGESLLLTATPRGPQGEALPERQVEWSSADVGVATVSQTGTVSAIAPGGPVEIRAVAGGVIGTASITVTPGAANRLDLTTQPSSTATSGEPLAVQPVVQLRDGAGNAIATDGAPVTVSLQSGGGTLSGSTTVTTDDGGEAEFTDLVISGSVGPRVLIFAATGFVSIASNPIALVAESGGGEPSRPAIEVQPSASAVSGVTFARQPVIRLLDDDGEPVPEAGVEVRAELASGSGKLQGTLRVLTDDDGVARFSDLRITGVLSGAHTIRFTAGGLASVVSEVVFVL